MRCAFLLPLLGLVAIARGDYNVPSTGIFHENVTFDGPNPTGVHFNYYEPLKVVKNAPLVLLLHGCSGSGQAQYVMWNVFPQLADKMGFPVLFPSSPHLDSKPAPKCWDVSSNGTLKHNGGGDSQGIASMVKWAAKKYHSDPRRLLVAGQSSGGMMTQVLVGAYPELFAAGVSVSGVPFGCFADPDGGIDIWSYPCALGNLTHTGKEWARLVRNAYPSYVGTRPKLQIHHGTIDGLSFVNQQEAIKQWTSVFGISTTPTQIVNGIPNANWTKVVYGRRDQLEAFNGQGLGHRIPFPSDVIIKYFDLECPAGNSTCYRKPWIDLP